MLVKKLVKKGISNKVVKQLFNNIAYYKFELIIKLLNNIANINDNNVLNESFEAIDIIWNGNFTNREVVPYYLSTTNRMIEFIQDRNAYKISCNGEEKETLACSIVLAKDHLSSFRISAIVSFLKSVLKVKGFCHAD